jgi:hypothetical protein
MPPVRINVGAKNFAFNTARLFFIIFQPVQNQLRITDCYRPGFKGPYAGNLRIAPCTGMDAAPAKRKG